MVSHDSASKECRRRIAEAYDLNKMLNGVVSEEDLNILKRKLEDQSKQSELKRLKQKLIGKKEKRDGYIILEG